VDNALVIARAWVMRLTQRDRRPRILVLDEATSHLDVSRERGVNTAIARLRITRIVIAHRPETIASAGRVIELRDPRITEGTPLTRCVS